MAAAAALALAFTGCATKSQTGTLAGAGLGAAAGSAVTGGDSTTGLLLGAVLGAVVGHEIGAELDRQDRLRAARALELNETYESTQWVNPDTGYQYQITPIETYRQPDGTPCREFRLLADVEGRADTVYGTACRARDGSWQIVS